MLVGGGGQLVIVDWRSNPPKVGTKNTIQEKESWIAQIRMFGCLGTPVLDPSSETSVGYADRPRKAPITKGGPNTEGIISTLLVCDLVID